MLLCSCLHIQSIDEWYLYYLYVIVYLQDVWMLHLQKKWTSVSVCVYLYIHWTLNYNNVKNYHKNPRLCVSFLPLCFCWYYFKSNQDQLVYYQRVLALLHLFSNVRMLCINIVNAVNSLRYNHMTQKHINVTEFCTSWSSIIVWTLLLIKYINSISQILRAQITVLKSLILETWLPTFLI